jgi:hypothetical protein
MCDTVAGELILCFHRMDVAALSLVSQLREMKIEHVEYADSLENKLATLGLNPDPELDFEFHLVRVPSGQESWKTTYLHFFYKHEMLKAIAKSPKLLTGPVFQHSDNHFTVSPNHLLSLAGSPSVVAPVSAKNFQFGGNHSYYQQAIGLPLASSSKPDKIRILLLDSGVAGDTAITVTDRRNIVDPNNPHNTADDHGHGTAVALLIHDLAPNAEFIVYKIADSTGRISEWDALAGIATKSDAHVVNLSLQFGLLDKGKGCAVCGRESRASRSAIFENILGQLTKRAPRPVVIAAAGNYQDKELAYPARFADVMAIGSITSHRVLTSDCNTGDKDHAGDPHKNHFVLPGGEAGPVNREPVMTSSGGKNWSGSSFAAAFASGLVAELLNRKGLQNFDFTVFVDSLRRSVDTNLPHYSSAEYGNGLMHA